MERRIHYLFVDLGYLGRRYRIFSEKWFRGKGEIDFSALYRHAHAPGKTFYYDFVDARDDEESAEGRAARPAGQDAYFDRIRSAPGAHVRTAAPARSPKDSHDKGVAVQLAVEMLQHATRGRMTHATLLSGDADFAPIVQALVEIGTDVTVWAEADAVAQTLRSAADHFLPLRWQDHHHWTEERIGATALLPGLGSSVASKLEGSRESFTRSGWTLLDSGTVGEARHRADLWRHPEPEQYSLAIEQIDAPEGRTVVTVAHSDRALLLRYADMEWGMVSLSPAEG